MVSPRGLDRYSSGMAIVIDLSRHSTTEGACPRKRVKTQSSSWLTGRSANRSQDLHLYRSQPRSSAHGKNGSSSKGSACGP
jgi:hypothetical protein